MDLELLGRRIREAREMAALSQGELAHLVGKDQRAISEYENGKRRIFANDLAVLAQVLNVSVLFFFEGNLSTDDLDRAALEEFQRIPTTTGKHTALEILRLFAHSIEDHRGVTGR